MAVTFAQIEPTTRCNYTCGFCVGRHLAQGDLAWDDFAAFLTAHPALAHVELQGEGEPLLHPRSFDMIAACKARGMRVSMISNGSLLGNTNIAALLGSGLDTLHISLETRDPARFQAIRGGRWDKVEAGLRRLVQARGSAGYGPRIGLAVTVLRDTLDAFEPILALYHELGLDAGISIQPLQSQPDYLGIYDAPMRARLLQRQDAPALRHLRAAAAALGPVDGFYPALFAGFDPARTGCPWLERGAYLAWDGRIFPCCFIKQPARAYGCTPSDPAARARRHVADAALRGGTVPPECTGCSTANCVASAHRRTDPYRLQAPLLAG
jgi:MoaA/NifB/PqqE/SkfB family radical SAM enzyme